jgi:hypothetical protein
MKRTTGIMVLLAALGGCSSFHPGSDFDNRPYYNYPTRPIPSPSPTSWKENENMARMYQASPAGMNGALAQAAPWPAPGPRTGVVADPGPVAARPQPGMPSVGDFSMSGPAPAALAANPIPAPPGPNPPPPNPLPASLTEAAKPAPASGPPSRPEPAGSPPLPDLAVPPAKGEVVTASAKTDPASPQNPIELVSVPPRSDKSDKSDLTPPPLPTAKTESVPGALEQLTSRPNSPAVRMVNSKHITINYEVKDVGPSGISGVELWYTQDGKTWQKRDVSNQAHPPYTMDVTEEGLYGFTLLARNGIGLSQETPKSGDLPQIWVEVDMTAPVVQLTGVNANCAGSTQNVIVRWKATDKNLGPRPITISYAEKEEGPWQPIAANVPNTGRYVWPMPPEAPSRFLVRVEAADIVGNIGTAQTPKPVLMDRLKPVVQILTVEGGKDGGK